MNKIKQIIKSIWDYVIYIWINHILLLILAAFNLLLGGIAFLFGKVEQGIFEVALAGFLIIMYVIISHLDNKLSYDEGDKYE